MPLLAAITGHRPANSSQAIKDYYVPLLAAISGHRPANLRPALAEKIMPALHCRGI